METTIESPSRLREYRLTDTDAVFFLHIPKAAGTTLGRLVESQFTQDEIFPPYWLEERQEVPPGFGDEYRLFRGHFSYMDIRTLLGDRVPVCLTMLRNPIDRFISHFAFFQHTRAKVDWYVTFADFPSLTLDEYARDAALVISTEGLNPQTYMIGGKANIIQRSDLTELASVKRRLMETPYLPRDDGRQQLRRAQQRLDTFAFVGLTERFQESLRLLCYTFGWRPVRNNQRLNVTPNRPLRDDVSPETLAQITSYNTLDLALYAYAEQQFDARYRAMIDDLVQRFGGCVVPTDRELDELLELHYAERFAEMYPPGPCLHVDFTRPVPGAGWHDTEIHPAHGRVRWIGLTKTASIDVPITSGWDRRVAFRVVGAMAPDILEGVTLQVNDVSIPLDREDDCAGGTIFSGRIPRETLAKRNSFARLVIETERTIRPTDLDPESSDSRALGVLINWIDLGPTNPYADLVLHDDPDGTHLYRIVRAADGMPIDWKHCGGPDSREEWLVAGAPAIPPADVPPERRTEWVSEQGRRPASDLFSALPRIVSAPE